jgi:CBS domain-containing protein
MTNAEIFLDHYLAIEKYLRRVYGSRGQYDTFLQLVTKAEKNHSVFSYYASDLREYGELRNAIVHNRAPSDNTIIAEPHSYVVERLGHIRKMIEDPLKIKDIMTSPVFIVKTDQGIFSTAQTMYKNIYTHVPVYDKGSFVGILSESALLRWVGYRTQSGEVLDKTNNIKAMVEFLDQPGNKFNDYIFLPRNTLILDAKQYFDTALRQGRRLGAVFITKTGKNTETIEGMLTAWDLPRIELD